MKLTTLTARNFKGLTFTLDLKDINFLVGSNFAGKTARTDAIRFLLLGYLPELGKTNTATFGLASGREMVVEGTMDNGLTIRRRLYLQGDSVKSENTIPPVIENEGQLAVMLNAETYFALSDRDRVTYVFNNVQMGPEWTINAITTRVLAAGTQANLGNKTIATLTDKFHELQSCQLNPQKFVEEALSWLTLEAKSAKEYATRMEKGAQAVTTMRTQDPTAVLPSKEQIDTEIERITHTLEEHQEAKTKHQEAYNAIVAARSRRRELSMRLESLPACQQRLADINTRLAFRQGGLNALPIVTQAQLDELRENEQTMRSRGAMIVEELRHNDNILKGIQDELNTLKHKTTCPYCGATGEGWKLKKEADIANDIKVFTSKRTELITEQTDVAEKHKGVTATRQRAVEILQNRNDLTREINSIERDLASTTGTLQLIETAKEELATLPAENPELQTKMETAQSAINVAQQALADIRRKRDQVIARENELQRIAQAEKQRDDAKAELEILVAVGKKLREIQAEMVAAAFKPLLQTANSFFSTILKSPLAYHQGEIGTWRNGVWVGHRTFSGTEKALCYAAIQAALASKSPIRIMLIDELGRLDKNNATALQACAEIAIEGNRIDQFVGIDATNRYEADFTNTSTQVIAVN